MIFNCIETKIYLRNLAISPLKFKYWCVLLTKSYKCKETVRRRKETIEEKRQSPPQERPRDSCRCPPGAWKFAFHRVPVLNLRNCSQSVAATACLPNSKLHTVTSRVSARSARVVPVRTKQKPSRVSFSSCWPIDDSRKTQLMERSSAAIRLRGGSGPRCRLTTNKQGADGDSARPRAPGGDPDYHPWRFGPAERHSRVARVLPRRLRFLHWSHTHTHGGKNGPVGDDGQQHAGISR